ncbi:MAG: SDR family oxidoreductase [Deltaproteobacteria bacterium]|nr:SDR family oxidoreductase [Deltaproteobacteria bacterium]
MNLVIGATGLLGADVCMKLNKAGHPVKAMVRKDSDPDKAKKLTDEGIDTVVADLKDKASLLAAMDGVKTVISTASSTFSRREGDTIESVDKVGQINAVDAAKKSGVDRFIFISFRDDPSVRYALTEAKRAVEDRLKNSGIGYTIIQASWFMEIWLSAAIGFDFENAKARLYGDGSNPVSYVSFVNVGDMVVAAVQNDASHNKVIQFGGREKLAPNDVVKIFEEVTGKQFEVEHVSEADLEEQRSAASDPLQQSFAGLMLQCAHGDPIDMDATIRTYGLSMTSVRDYAKAVAS